MPTLDPVLAALRRLFNTQGNHEKRIRALERLGDGIHFNRDEEGGWLYIVANDSTDIAYGEHAIVFADTTGEGVLLQTTTGFVDVSSLSVSISSNAQITLGSALVEASLLTAGKLRVKDHLAASIFEVRDDGSVHIKTGTAIIADL